MYLLIYYFFPRVFVQITAVDILLAGYKQQQWCPCVGKQSKPKYSKFYYVKIEYMNRNIVFTSTVFMQETAQKYYVSENMWDYIICFK